MKIRGGDSSWIKIVYDYLSKFEGIQTDDYKILLMRSI
jgi:hypothetical protein